MAFQSIHELAGLQQDPLAEEVLAVLYSDQPVRSIVRPSDSRRHWQWWVRDPEGSTSRLWLSFAQPMVSGTAEQVEDRVSKALTVLVPTFVTAVEVNALQTSFTQIQLEIILQRPKSSSLTIGLILNNE